MIEPVPFFWFSITFLTCDVLSVFYLPRGWQLCFVWRSQGFTHQYMYSSKSMLLFCGAIVRREAVPAATGKPRGGLSSKFEGERCVRRTMSGTQSRSPSQGKEENQASIRRLLDWWICWKSRLRSRNFWAEPGIVSWKNFEDSGTWLGEGSVPGISWFSRGKTIKFTRI